ncbi:hypothetical protein KY385_02385 [Candidatus Parcubacteria bacterium]|nr:hypothetical protein [Candidatus Parcubacteria bacterium]
MREKDRLAKKYRSSTRYILSGLIPYTEANVKLSFKPSAFFNDLEKLDRVYSNKKALQNAYYRSIKKGLVELSDDGIPRLTDKGRRRIREYEPKKIKNGKLMVVFDIPEAQRLNRNRLRTLLKELDFKQVQKSVWISNNDSREYLKLEIKQNKLENFVEVFEARSINI